MSFFIRGLNALQRSYSQSHVGQWAMNGAAFFAAACTVAMLCAVVILLGFLLFKGLPTLNVQLFFGDASPLEAILGRQAVWDGLWPACAGTLCLVGLTLCLALPPGLGCGIYLAEYAGPAQRRRITYVVDVLAGMPSIVMGLFGFTLILFLRHTSWPEANTGLLPAALCLALLVLPVVITTVSESLQALPEGLRFTCTALGFTRRKALRAVLLPAAGRGICGGAVLALGRAAEDTAVILLTGVVANAGLPSGLAGKFEALPFAVYYTAAQYQSQAELSRGFGAALVLLCLSVALLTGGHLLTQAMTRRGAGAGRTGFSGRT